MQDQKIPGSFPEIFFGEKKAEKKEIVLNLTKMFLIA